MMQSRPYQVQAIAATLRDIRSGQYEKPVMVLPTGGGKTFTATRILRGLVENDLSAREVVVWITHRKELVQQTAKAFVREGLSFSHWNADEKSLDGKIILAMVASSRKLAEELEAAGLSCRYVVIDEAHHAAAASYQTLQDKLDPKCTLNLTATPIRMDDLDLEFDKVSYQKTFLELVEEGYLAKPRYIKYQTGLSYRLRGREEFSSEDLNSLNDEKRNEIIAKDYQNNIDEYGKTVVFAVNVEHANTLRAKYRDLMPDLATGIVTGDTPPEERVDTLNRFKDGRIKVLFNVQVLTEGFDDPTIKTIQLTRPTKSEVLWAQMIGRASRPHETKPHFNIVDYVDSENNYGVLAEDWTIRLLGMEESPERKKEREDAATLELVNDWLKDVGHSKRLKHKREVLELDGVIVVNSKKGTKRIIVKRQHKRRLDQLVEYVIENPPKLDDRMMDYIMKFAYQRNKSLLKWPGKFLLTSIAWGLYFRYVLKRPAGNGQPGFAYRKLPDFSQEVECQTTR